MASADSGTVYTWDSHTLGFTCFRGDEKLCNYFTHSDIGLYLHGSVVFRAVLPERRYLHFTSPTVNLEDLRAVLDTLPRVEDHPHSKTVI